MLSLELSNAKHVFSGPTLTREDTRVDDDEQRFKTTDLLGTCLVVITHTEAPDSIHIISMRKAEPHEIADFV